MAHHFRGMWLNDEAMMIRRDDLAGSEVGYPRDSDVSRWRKTMNEHEHLELIGMKGEEPVRTASVEESPS